MAALRTTEREHADFLRDFAALQLTWAWHRARTTGRRPSEVIAAQTFVVTLTDWHRGWIYDPADLDPAAQRSWRQFLTAADDLATAPDAPTSAAAAGSALVALLPPPGDRVARDLRTLHDPVHGPAAMPSCLWTDTPTRTLDTGGPGAPAADLAPDGGPDGGPRILAFHIANNRYPDSLLRHPDDVRRDIDALARTAADLGYTAIGTRTWLNDHPAWLAIWPAVWLARRGPAEPVGPDLGSWGQCITARHTLSARIVAVVHATGELPLAQRTSHITLDAWWATRDAPASPMPTRPPMGPAEPRR